MATPKYRPFRKTMKKDCFNGQIKIDCFLAPSGGAIPGLESQPFPT
jgi:hypothetical protein